MASKKDGEGSADDQIFRYYKKFSQNKNLPKYFSGPSVSYLPEFKENFDDEKEEPPSIIITTDVDVVITNIDDEGESQFDKDTSRASSAMSNRKLEWDNLADIGYENSQQLIGVKKSSSLPTLADMKEKKVDFHIQHSSKSSKVSDNSDSNNRLVIVTYSSSSLESLSPKKKADPTSSSSSVEEEKKPILSSSGSSSEIPKVSSSSSDSSSKNFASALSFLKKKIGLPDAQSTPNDDKSIDNKIIHLKDTPHVKKAHSVRNKNFKSKDLEIKENRTTKIVKKVINLAVTKPISIECVCDDEKSKTTKNLAVKMSSNVGVQTEDISEKELIKVIAKSRENLNQSVLILEHGSDKISSSSQTNSDVQADSFEYIKNKKEDIVEIEIRPSSGSESSAEARLAEVIASNNQTEDLEKKIYLLHRLLKSKKYDEATKKRYIKKIIKKITESGYLEESSTSSELFLPKKTNKSHIDNIPIQTSSTNSSAYTSSSRKGILKKTLVHKKNLEVITTSYNNIFPVQVQQNDTTDTSLEKQYDSGSSSRSLTYMNWKEDKTISEQRLEQKTALTLDKSRDFISHVVNKERQYQLNWINSEIDQLGKLKNLLEKHVVTEKKPSSKKSKTSVYVVSEDSDCATSSKKFVIETQLNSDPEKSSKRTFHLAGKKYTVNEVGDGTYNEVRGEIEVFADDNATNIKITTFCDNCKRSPCICVTEFLECRRNPFESKENDCPICTNYPCSCSSKTICIKCHNAVCTCKGAISKKCSQCDSYPCKCLRKTTVSYEGEFIPAIVPGDILKQMEKSSKSGSSESSKSSSTSLKNIFKTCKCSSEKNCNCEFVDKMYKHMIQSRNASDQSKRIETHIKNVQTGDGMNKNTLIQTENEKLAKKEMTCQCSCPDCMKASIQTDNYHASTEQQYENLNVVSSSVQTEEIVILDKPLQSYRHIEIDSQTTKPDLVHKEQNVDDLYLTHETQTDVVLKKDKNIETEDRRVDAACLCQILGISKFVQTEKTDGIHKEQLAEGIYLDDGTQTGHGDKKRKVLCQCDLLEVGKVVQTEKQETAHKAQYVEDTHSSSETQTSPVSKKSEKIDTKDENKDFLSQYKTLKSEKVTQTEKQKVLDKEQLFKPDSFIKTQTSNILKTSKEIDSREDLVDITGLLTDPLIKKGGKSQLPESTSTSNLNLDENLKKVSENKILYKKDSTTQATSRKARKILRPESTTSSSNLNGNKDLKRADLENKISGKRDSKTQTTSTSNLNPDERTESESQNHLKRSTKSQMTSTRKEKTVGLPETTSPSDLSTDKNQENVGLEDTTPSYSETLTSSTTTSYIECLCCKKPTPVTNMSVICCNNEDYYLCKCCMRKKPILTTICYAGPKHPYDSYDLEPVKLTPESSKMDNYCTCSKPLRMTHSDYCSQCHNRVRSTDDTSKFCCCAKPSMSQHSEYCGHCRNRLRSAVQSYQSSDYCSCTKPSRLRHSQYCGHCQYKLRRTLKSKNGIAYTLTLEEGSPKKMKRAKRKKNKLEEIKVKIPSFHDRKRHKEEMNLSRKEKKSDSKGLQEEEKKLKDDTSGNDNELIISSSLTLQEHLRQNRPDFIDSAEYRRIAVLNSKIGRELSKDEEKLRMLEEKLDKDNKEQKQTRLFSEREMREITSRNYKKLPEVQKKLHHRKQQRLRTADKVMAGILAKKVQRNVLKGRSRFPIDSKLVTVNHQ